MKEPDYIESFIKKYYLIDRKIEKDGLKKYLESNKIFLDESLLEKRILIFKNRNGIDI